MDSSSFEGLVLDPSKCSKLSMEEKREIVYELAKWSHGAPEMLQTWSRQEILQILCAEMGKERKYTGLTKLKIIENLLKIVSEKNSQGHESENNPDADASPIGQRASKRQRKSEHPTRITMAVTDVLTDKGESDVANITYCKNSACKAKLSPKDKFCKRCSCCICHKYDDNKDPSLWLTCCSDPPYHGESCGMSCHLECAFRHQKSGIAKAGMDGSFFCVSCGKLNDLLGCWRKQLITAKETRRVDILCYRISLSQKLLSGTKHYQKLYEIMDEAVNKLEADVGPLTGLPVKMARGIVNRLSSGPEVQRLCAFALESLDLILSESAFRPSNHFIQESNMIASNITQLEDVSSSSVTVILGSKDSRFENISGYTIWHRKAEERGYAEEPTSTIVSPSWSYLLSGLSPATKYFIKVVCFDSSGELGFCEVQFQTISSENEVPGSNNLAVERSESPTTNSSSLSNPSSVEDETNNIALIENGKISSATLGDVMKCGGICRVGNLGDSDSLFGGEGNGGKLSSTPGSNGLNVENKDFPEGQTIGETSNDNGSNIRTQMGIECEADLPITPCKLESVKDGIGRNVRGKPNKNDYDNGSGREEEPQDGSSSKKRSGERRDEENLGNGNRDFEYYVKVIRWLECQGHIETNFRQKFLTWYSLRATPQEMRVVKVFVDTLIDEPASLAGQLVDAFSEAVSSKRPFVVPSGFCMKLWH